MNLASKLEVVNVSDTGLKRPHNEDSSITDPANGIAIVADGMGGYKAGEVASAIAAKAILDEVHRGLASDGSLPEDHDYSARAALLRDAIRRANKHIFETAQTVPQCQGMGTTVVSLLFYDNKISVAHVGDSRLYRLRGEAFEQVTNDHSLVQELVDRGFFTAEEAEANTPKNLVTRALGIEDSVDVDLHEDSARTGDVYLLCSDGLNDMVTDEEIHLTLSKYCANLEQAAHQLIELANENGGKDNITVVLVRVKAPFPAPVGLMSKFRR